MATTPTTPATCRKPGCRAPATHEWVVPTPFGTERQSLCLDHAEDEKAHYGRASSIKRLTT